MSMIYCTALADAAVHHHDRNMLICGDAQEIRPDFRFYQDDGLGIDDGQDAVGQIWQVQREIEDPVGALDDLMGHAEARRRDDGDDDDFVGMGLAHFPDNRAGRDDFPDRRGMDPDGMAIGYFIF